MGTKSIQLKTFLCVVLSILLLEVLSSVVRISGLPPLLLIGVTRILDIFLLLAIVLRIEKKTSVIGIEPSTLLNGIKKGALWSIAFAILAAIFALVLLAFKINPLHLLRTPLPDRPGPLLLFFIVGGVIAPIAEEFFFRGIVFCFFRRMGFWFALLFSTLIFAYLHSTASAIPITQLVGGIVFASAFEIEKNLAVPMVIHILGNLSIFSISFLTN